MTGSRHAHDSLAPASVGSPTVQAEGRRERRASGIGALGILLATIVVLALVRPVQAAQRTLAVGQPRPARTVRFLHVDVGGYKLEMVCAGQASPTVVFEAGSGADWSTWTSVIPGLLLRRSALIHLQAPSGVQYCAYSRAGNGTSAPSPYPRDSRTIVRELHTLLTRGHIVGPYILVGHSMGGIYIRLYAYTYPQDVVGMVLVDSAHEDQIAALNAIGVDTSCAPPASVPECAAWARDQAKGIQPAGRAVRIPWATCPSSC
jgi:pimeloyl-ACP methyl ester carboxylesterase